MLHQKYYDWNGDRKRIADKAKADAAKLKKDKVALKNHPAIHAYGDFEGLYTNPGYGSMKIIYKNDSLFCKTTDRIFWLKHDNYDFFSVYEKDPVDGVDASEESDLKMRFNMNATGDIESISSQFEAGLSPIVFKKGAEAKAMTAAELQKYTGEFVLGGITAKVSVRGNTLYILVPGQP